MIDRNTIIGFDAKRIVSNNTGLGSYSRTLVNDLAAATEARLLLFAPTSGRTELRRQIARTWNLFILIICSTTACGTSWRGRGGGRQA